MTTISLHRSHLAGIVNLAAFTPTDKLDAAGILGTVQVTLEDVTATGYATNEYRVRLTAIATDRYMVGEYVTEFTAENLPHNEARELLDVIADGPFSFLLSAELLRSVKLAAADFRFPVRDWTITLDDSADQGTAEYGTRRVTISNGVRSITADVQGGNFPSVGRILPTEPPEDLQLAPVYALSVTRISRIAAVRPPTSWSKPADDLAVWRLTGTPSPNPSRPGPVIWTKTFDDTHAYRVLLQPNLIVH